MLNNLYKNLAFTEEAINNKCIEDSIDNNRTVKAPFSVAVFYHSNDDSKITKKAHGLWITSEKICLKLIFDKQRQVDEILILRFKLPEQHKSISLQVKIDQILDDKVIATHKACHKHSTDYHANNVVEFLATATWNKAYKVYGKYPNIKTCQAKSFSQFDETTRLLYKEYRIKGYCSKKPFTSYFNYFAILPDSKTFLIHENQQLLGTFSFIPDSPFGLPSESIYSYEINNLRVKKRKVAELSLLSFDAEKINSRNSYLLLDPYKMFLFVKLVKACVEYAYEIGVTDLIVATNPVHIKNYQLLMFKTLGEEKIYQAACGNPAILLHANLNEIRNKLDTFETESGASLIAYLYRQQAAKNQRINNHIATLLAHSCPHIPEEVFDYIHFCYHRT